MSDALRELIAKWREQAQISLEPPCGCDKPFTICADELEAALADDPPEQEIPRLKAQLGDVPSHSEPSEVLCQLCGEPMSRGEEMFNYHGYSGDCPKPPLAKAPAPAAEAPRLPSCYECGSNRVVHEKSCSQWSANDEQVERSLMEPRAAEAGTWDARPMIAAYLAELEDKRLAGTNLPWTIANLLPLAERAYAAGQAAKDKT